MQKGMDHEGGNSMNEIVMAALNEMLALIKEIRAELDEVKEMLKEKED